uniref:Uncharacterized protein n=1 Tax=Rhizophora mucronata TaxID=61149 RepID=A0A2P2PC99_RHIMU
MDDWCLLILFVFTGFLKSVLTELLSA